MDIPRKRRREGALLVDRLMKVYADGTHALDRLEFPIAAGSFFGLFGSAARCLGSP